VTEVVEPGVVDVAVVWSAAKVVEPGAVVVELVWPPQPPAVTPITTTTSS
jgi:hypothetical protein